MIRQELIDHCARRPQSLERFAVRARFAVPELGRRPERRSLQSRERRSEPRREPNVARHGHAHVDARIAVDGAEQTRRAVGVLGRSNEQIARRIQGEMKRGANLSLSFPVEVDQQVAAGNEIGVGERRILQETVSCEQHHVAQLARDTVLVALPCEESPQTLFAHIRFDGERITAVPPESQGGVIEIGRKNLDLRPDLPAAGLLEQQHRDRIGLFASRAARNPDANWVGRAPVLEELRNDQRAKPFESAGVAKECGHRDQKIGEQSLRLRRAVAQDCEIIAHRRGALHLHAAKDTAPDGRFLVTGEIVPGARAQLRQDPLQRLLVGFARRLRPPGATTADQFGKSGGDLAHRQDKIGEARRDGAARHRGEFGLVRVLNQDSAACLLDRLDAERAVRARSRQHDREVVAPLGRERAEEEIDRRAPPAGLLELGDLQMLVLDAQLTIGGNDVDMARMNPLPATNLSDRHFGSRGENIWQLALVFRIEMDDDDEGRVDLVRQTLEEHLERANAAGRGSDADRREPSCDGFGLIRRLAQRLIVSDHGSLLDDAFQRSGLPTSPISGSRPNLEGRGRIPDRPTRRNDKRIRPLTRSSNIFNAERGAARRPEVRVRPPCPAWRQRSKASWSTCFDLLGPSL